METSKHLRVCKRLLSTLGAKKHGDLYNVTRTRNSASRMRTVTPENQYQRLEESATPLAKYPYSEQLKMKRAVLERALQKVVNITRHSKRGALPADVAASAEQNHGCLCPLEDMKPSPKIEGFRNKEELSVNTGVDGDPNTVGLTIGRGGNQLCVPCSGLVNTKPLHHGIVETFKSFLAQSRFRRRGADSADQASSSWCQVTIRSNEAGQVMLVPELKCREITQDVIDEAKDELLHFYCSRSPASQAVQSLYLRVRRRGSKVCHSQHHLHGDSHLAEEVLGYRFLISPQAFFQLNTPGAGVLYTQVQDMVQGCRPHTLLDVGCGTGTIGITMSSLVHRVVGLDVVQQAVQDARLNAGVNGVQNASFLWGSARQLMKTHLMEGDVLKLDGETMAVVNPSRNGLNKKAIQRLRCCEPIRHLVYISCKPRGNALINFLDLVVEESEDHPGEPFRAVKAVGVDMFPQTIHSELVLLFQR
ncbi:tRNA (uracil-5-)-methyltransferase homolog A-like isoform X2 [Babylonia areolata]